MVERKYLLKTIRERWHRNYRDLSTGRARNYHWLLCLTNWSKLLKRFVEASSSRFTSLNVIKSQSPYIRPNYDKLRDGAIVQTCNSCFPYNINSPDDLIRFLSLLENSYFVIEATTDKDINIGVILRGYKMSNFGRMFAQCFHFCPIGRIMKSNVAFCITNNHSFLQEIELECGDLICGYIHADSLDIAVESTPHFDLIAHGSEERKFLLNILAAYCGVLVRSVRMVVFIVFIHIDGLPTEYQLEGFVNYHKRA